jgi:hypothetical protein
MTTTINASTSTGLVSTADTSGIIKLQSNGVTTNALAWAIFNGTTTGSNAPTASYNVSSITRNSTGLYSVSFTNALADTNYIYSGFSASGNNTFVTADSSRTRTTSVCQFYSLNSAGPVDGNPIGIVFFGN